LLKNKNIYFIFPYKGTGGVSILFLRMATYLANIGYKNIYLVDYIDGYMAKNYDKTLLKFQEYSQEKELEITGNSIVIFQTMTPWSIYPFLKITKEVKVLFWNCHPMNLLPRAPFFGLNIYHNEFLGKVYLSLLFTHKKTLRVFLETLLKKKSILFMDYINVDITKRFLGDFNDVQYLPIPSVGLKGKKYFSTENNLNQDSLRITYVGRVEDFKVPPLKKVIKDISTARRKFSKKIIFNIIGSGDSLDYIKEFSRNFKNIQFKFIDYLTPEELENFYINNTDLTIAMGTAALDSARCSKPTILLDFSFSDLDDKYKYKWIYETKGFSLADYISKGYIGEGTNTISSIFNQLESNYEQICKHSFEYFDKNHNIKKIINDFIIYLDDASCSWGDLDDLGILYKGIIYKIYRNKGIFRKKGKQ